MSKTLIPRVKVNYTLCDIFRAFTYKGRSFKKRNMCIEELCKIFPGHCIKLVPSSRDAIYELLIRLPQKKVVIPAYTCMVVNEAVLLSGKEIVFSKTSKEDFNSSYIECIDNDCIVLATHQYGLPCNIEGITAKCKETGAVLIEDCATSLGTIVNGKMTGTFGDFACISLNASKTLTVPPFGGILIGKDNNILNDIEENSGWKRQNFTFRLKAFVRAFAFVVTKNPFIYKMFHYLTIDRKGKLQRTEHENPAEQKTDYYKFCIEEWQASILLKQLKNIDKIISRRKYIYDYYDNHINNPLVTKPICNDNAVCTRYAILVNDRLSFYKQCIAKGIDMDFSHCSIGCPHNDTYKEEHDMAKKILNLPFYYELSDKEMKKVVEVINSIR